MAVRTDSCPHRIQRLDSLMMYHSLPRRFQTSVFCDLSRRSAEM